MRRSLSIIIMLVLLFTIGCESKKTTVNSVSEKKETIKAVVPFAERKFIYTNGITIEQKELKTRDEKGVAINQYYPVISGLKNKAVQDKINWAIVELGKKQMSQLESELASKQQSLMGIASKSVNAYITYNYNNAIFVGSNASLDIRLEDGKPMPNLMYTAYGFDLNTGEQISFEDLFKPDSDYKTKINNYICQYIIENNFDDYNYSKMTKPFQGIKENQSFNLVDEGLVIIFDEKSDEFMNYDYPEQILIPFKYIGEDLYIFDRYFDEGHSIFEKDKLSKKLLPNNFGYKINKLANEGKDNCYLSYMEGSFIGIPNKDIEKRLNEIAACSLNVEDFKKRAEAAAAAQRLSFTHNVNITLNAGGYLSMVVSEDEFQGEKSKINNRFFNYDFNRNKEICLGDIFTDDAVIKKVLKKYIREMNNSITEEMEDRYVNEALEAQNFYIADWGVTIYLPMESIGKGNVRNWETFFFDQMGKENIKLFN